MSAHSAPLRRAGSELLDAGGVLLAGLGSQLSLEPGPTDAAAFLVARATRTASRLIFPVGAIPRLLRYTLCHRYEPWWMKPSAGERLRDVPAETQFFLAELEGGAWLLLVPLLDEPWRFSLRGRSDDTLELLAETGDPHLGGWGGLALFVGVGTDPFDLLERGARAVQRRLGTGPLREDKPLPEFVDHFGWCTWDAFYTDVSADKVRAGLEQLGAAGVPPRFIILDDGWQSVREMPTGERRLTAFAPNEKFGADLSALVASAKRDYGVETFLVWHAVVGYWGGVDGEALGGYDVVEQPRRFGEGIMAHCPRHNEDWWGGLVGLVPEASIERFYDDYHRSLARQGVDGVKVDNQAVLEGLAARQGGRVRLNRAYRQALERSVARHFEGRVIHCMANAQEAFYGSPASTLTRTSIDFFPARPETHSAHLYTNAHVGLWFGQFMWPDWDMFQSAHAFGAFHAAGRAVSGGPVYVSDKPGEHDRELLQQLVCSDGSVLRADGPGLPTLDTLCVDPTRAAVPLKIWNRSGLAGIVGAFHARYAAGRAEAVAGQVRASDVPGLTGEHFACYAFRAARLHVLGPDEAVSFRLDEAQFELFWLVPIERGFAPLGLAGKLNGPRGLLALDWLADGRCSLQLRDGGAFLAYAERPPRSVTADAAGSELGFDHDAERGLLRVELGTQRAFTVSW
ncbi:MAG TPA: Sip1-related alpha-galactosidase [Polyangiaceae bacterium]|nr:Sip1-related alpha-galactosidase [Polyangiaceae bacterium]